MEPHSIKPVSTSYQTVEAYVDFQQQCRCVWNGSMQVNGSILHTDIVHVFVGWETLVLALP